MKSQKSVICPKIFFCFGVEISGKKHKFCGTFWGFIQVKMGKI